MTSTHQLDPSLKPYKGLKCIVRLINSTHKTFIVSIDSDIELHKLELSSDDEIYARIHGIKFDNKKYEAFLMKVTDARGERFVVKLHSFNPIK